MNEHETSLAAAPRRRDPQATRAALMAAARTEFAARGLAGARVDEIARTAGVNKRMIYVYFEHKRGLFDAVVDATITQLLDDVPFDPDDLAGYAVSYFDQLVADPEALHLTMWRSLERVEPSPDELRSFGAKIDAIATAQARGVVVEDMDPADVLALLLSMSRSWLSSTRALHDVAADRGEAANRLADHRRSLGLAVGRALTIQ